eukprot:3197846-Pleurochrysis_carterae.AAC.2
MEEGGRCRQENLSCAWARAKARAKAMAMVRGGRWRRRRWAEGRDERRTGVRATRARGKSE